MRGSKSLHPAFPFLNSVWEDIVYDLGDREIVALWRLVRWYCDSGPLPNDDQMLAQVARVDKRTWVRAVRPKLAIKFSSIGSHWHWAEIDTKIADYQKKIGDKRKGAASTNMKRWGNSGLRCKHRWQDGVCLNCGRTLRLIR
ncbi:DUF1376 domain-containing protein [Bradyrhizobium sp. 1(2017)]|uniref:DUF1376 domain-containing protein n=1 Tax=Bradyrhizobium sp. 1(2017) TaxID=1404888 RepID=UPI00140F1FE8|nr:DUF1376 domain-containing protein [Bradyrhizobium sp. 1(2017)]QIO34345.1 DUF1376 domain-containing protein [Bradyrhizobium sp. 1(2017)]